MLFALSSDTSYELLAAKNGGSESPSNRSNRPARPFLQLADVRQQAFGIPDPGYHHDIAP
jgi:hypothetical protein